ncbi:MAG: nitric oxide reductase activation protein NorD [Alphaproteobacteria bacterium]
MADPGPAFLRVVSDGDEPGPLSRVAARAFPEEAAARWLRAQRKLSGAGYGPNVLSAYVQQSPHIALLVGPDAAIELAETVSAVAIKAGLKAAEALPWAALKVAERLQDLARFRAWLSLIQRFAALAPESVDPVLDRMERLIAGLTVSRLEAWLLAGVRTGGSDRERRLRFFLLEDPEAERWLQRESGDVLFTDVDRRLKAYLAALWRVRVPIREPSLSAPAPMRRRAGFGRGIIRMPATFPGYRGRQAEDLFRAALAHIGAHFTYSGPSFPIGSLKPLQVALVSLIEDARVEQLAMQEFPGLARLWLPFHIAQASGATTAPSLLARLSRALIDPEFADLDGWVRKGREMFLAVRDQWHDPAVSRRIGGLLGNDLGQMRIQFNAKSYIVEPPYRDDNLGLWDFGDQAADIEETELVMESVRIARQDEDDRSPPDRERREEEPEETPNVASLSPQPLQADGIPVARYPEYDYATGRERSDWTTLVEYRPTPGPAARIDDILDRHHGLVTRITGLIRSARVSRPQRLKRQHEGDQLDLDACIGAAVSRRIGETPDPRVFSRAERRSRDLSVLLLLDVSESTRDRVRSGRSSVLEVEREAAVLLAHAMDGLGDPFAIAAFCSNRRDDVRYRRIKDFDAPYDALARAGLAGLESELSTRLGAAMRHAGVDLGRQLTHRRLLLVVTDGEPSDIDIEDRTYLVEDARRAVSGLAGQGIDTFCVGLDSGGDSYLARIFGRRNFVQIDRLERLPEKLPMLYFRLTA